MHTDRKLLYVEDLDIFLAYNSFLFLLHYYLSELNYLYNIGLFLYHFEL